MKPPIRSSIFCPSTVWVLISSPLVRVELARLVDDLLGDRDLADVVQERAEFEVAPLLGVEAERVGDVEREPDDALAVRARVAVVGLDHVTEDERGPAVGAVQLDQALHALRALPANTASRPSSGSGASATSGRAWTCSATTSPMTVSATSMT